MKCGHNNIHPQTQTSHYNIHPQTQTNSAPKGVVGTMKSSLYRYPLPRQTKIRLPKVYKRNRDSSE